MIRYLLDTNIVSEPMRVKPNARVLKNLKAHGHQAAISSVVWHELMFGVQLLDKSNKRDRLRSYLETIVQATLPIIAYDEKAAGWHAHERARLQKKGIQSSFADGQIAAVAYVNDLVLVTRNEVDFSRFENIKIENWFR